ncbi:hypothetical protein [Knoellia sp. p5-6-4]|uniref:hypothetical protein n=1 Tax=unclassified Knoellia TaxID=2618719 RepID=UPI0023DCA7A2|nr:hypothetical protein [Knoellia sp. p5-6-4]MDF2144645.1 hypothetical protein [Knoellia sp. p5-6-4]
MAAYQASLLPSLDHARTKAEATAVADCFVTGLEADGADVETVVVVGLRAGGELEAGVVPWVETLGDVVAGAAAGCGEA